jgi:hypothetical protein
MANGEASRRDSGRVEFRVVLDGVNLDERQRERIAVEVQRAAIEALLTKVEMQSPVLVGHASLRLQPEWYGIWVLDGPRALDLGGKLDDLGFYRS